MLIHFLDQFPYFLMIFFYYITIVYNYRRKHISIYKHVILIFVCCYYLNVSQIYLSEYFNFNSFPIELKELRSKTTKMSFLPFIKLHTLLALYIKYIYIISAMNSYELFNKFRFQTRIEKYLV